jgi:Transcription factor TFIID complex subunit 8 C-term
MGTYTELKEFCKLLIDTPAATPSASGQLVIPGPQKKRPFASMKEKKKKSSQVFPNYPTKHSYLSTKIPLHPLAPTIATREQQRSERLRIMKNLVRIKKVDSMFEKFGVVDVGFVNYSRSM